MNFDVKKWVKDNGATILTWISAGGTIATVALAVTATPKAHDKLVDARAAKAEEKDIPPFEEPPKLTVLETIKTCWKDYIPTGMALIATLACIFGANVMNKNKQAELTSAYIAFEQLFQNYRKKADMICGEGTDRTISRAILQEEAEQKQDDAPPWDEKQTFYLECCEEPRFFERTMEEVLQAEYEINRYFCLNGEITLNEFRQVFGLEPVQDGDVVGWDSYIGETTYGYRWIDFDHRHYATDDGLMVCSIDMPFGPHPLDENAEE